MDNKESFATINVGKEKYPVTQDNATLYKHLGNAAIDHLFVSMGENKGVYVWSDNPTYEAVAELAVKNECMLVLNIKEPSETDIKVYIKHHTEDIVSNDTFPSDWK